MRVSFLLTGTTVPAFAQQLPTGGTVAAGNATIAQPNANTLNINQSTNQAILNWQSFSVGSGGTVNFNSSRAPSSAPTSAFLRRALLRRRLLLHRPLRRTCHAPPQAAPRRLHAHAVGRHVLGQRRVHLAEFVWSMAVTDPMTERLQSELLAKRLQRLRRRAAAGRDRPRPLLGEKRDGAVDADENTSSGQIQIGIGTVVQDERPVAPDAGGDRRLGLGWIPTSRGRPRRARASARSVVAASSPSAGSTASASRPSSVRPRQRELDGAEPAGPDGYVKAGVGILAGELRVPSPPISPPLPFSARRRRGCQVKRRSG